LGKTTGEIEAMPATEFAGWKAYFDIYPFTQDREDYRTALLAAVVSNMSGRTLKTMREVEDFLPNYLKPAPKEKSLEQQRADKQAFKAMLQAAQRGTHANR
jgi:hypothetical protein